MTEYHMQRLIGRYTGPDRGPLLICFGGMHGNEPAGIMALDLMFKMLEVEPITNPDFHFRGRLVGLRGNLKAIERKQRYLVKDLNRQWTLENINRVRTAPLRELDAEDQELRSLLKFVEAEIEDYQPERLIVLDLHTTTAEGGIFTISTDDPESVRIGVELHAPVIKGFLEGIRGTTLHYFNNDNFETETVGVVFESGQHDDPLSVNRAIAALTNCMRTVGCVEADHVENRHDQLLIEYSKNLPKVAQLVGSHPICPEDQFQMIPGYLNFHSVKKGEIIAHDKNGPIAAEEDGLLLMPLYQAQGEDGFFLIQPLEGY